MKRSLLLLCLLVSYVALSQPYIEGTFLLKCGGQEIRWGQGENHVDGCSPSYNKYCPSGYSGDPCDHNLTGCGATAMAMCMRKWEWPLVTSYSYYRWDLMNSILSNGDNDFIPKLMRDCGLKANMTYENFAGIHSFFGKAINGSWTTSSNIKEGLDDMNYNAICYDRGDWKNYSGAWLNLIKSEIDCGRPVIVYGQDADGVHNIIYSHHYVIDGYKEDSLHCNFGWRGFRNSFKTWYDIVYNHDAKIIVGISPDYVSLLDNISDVSYEVITANKQVAAKHVIALPAEGKVLQNNSTNKHLAIIAGDSVILKPGARLTNCQIIIRPELAKAQPIVYQQINHIMQGQCQRSPNYNNVRFATQNADSWECAVYDRVGKCIWRDAGLITNDTAYVWNGSSSDHLLYAETYWLDITLKNSYGSIVNFTSHVAYDLSPCVINYRQLNMYVSPNCVDGINDYLEFETDAETWSCKIFKRDGAQIWSSSGTVVDGNAKVWDGSAYRSSYLIHRERYFYEVTFRTSDGGYVVTSGDVYYLGGDCNGNLNNSETMEVMDVIM